MDLECNRHTKYAELFLRRYSEQFPAFNSPGDHIIFNYFKALRANVRAKVHAIGAKGEENPADVLKHISEAKKYLMLLSKYIS
jgi:aminoglycoside phosphotransferase family enzyme